METYNIKRKDLLKTLKQQDLFRISDDKRFLIRYYYDKGDITSDGWEFGSGRRYSFKPVDGIHLVPTLGYITYEEVLKEFPEYEEY